MPSKTTRFEKLLEAVPDALVGMDQKGVIRFVNCQTESLFGYDRDQLIGQRIEMLVPESLWQIYTQHRRDYFADLRTRSSGLDVVLSGRQQDGTEFPINVSLSHIDTGDVLLVITAALDVTQQKQAVKNAQLTAAIVQYSDDAIISSTLTGMITTWNPAAEEMYGYSAAEIIGRSVRLLTPEDQAGLVDALLVRIKNGEAVDHLEIFNVRKDGTAFPVSITIAPIRDEDGAVVGASGVHRDVTEQRQALTLAQRMAAIVENSNDAIIGETLDGIITSWNPAAERMYGYSGAEIIGKSGSRLSPEDRAGEMYAVLAAIKAGQPVEHIEINRVRKDGTVFPVLISIAPIRDEDGAIVGASSIARDVTEQRHALAAAQRMAAIVEHSDDAITGRTLDGIITSWNPAAERMFGYSSAEIVGTSADLLIPEDRAGEAAEVVAKIGAGQHVQHLETIRVRKDGTVFPVSLTFSPIRNADGTVVGESVICRDVTEQRQAFEAAQRMAAIVEFSGEGIASTTLDGVITSWNPSAERMFGYKSEEIISKSVTFLSPEGRTSEAATVLAKVRAGQAVEDFETVRVRKDGTVFPASLTVAPIRDEDDAVVGASVICRDVTNERQALAAAQRMAAIVEDAEDAIISGSLNGIIMSWNPAAERMYGYSSAEIIGKPAKFLTPRDRVREITAVLGRIKAGQHVEHLETKRVRKDGTVFPVSLTVSPIRDADGAIVGTSVIHRDLTEQKGALALAQRLAAIIESSDDAIVARTLGGVIMSWNPAAERMFGYSSAEMVGQPTGLLTPEDRAGERISILAKISAGHPVENFETIRIRKDGTVFPVSLTTSPIRDDKGTVVGVSVIYRDVSELKHAAQYARSLIEAALDPLVTISPEGKIYDVNEATVKATGVPRSKLIGTDFSGYFTDPDKAHQGYQRAFAQGSVTDYPLTLRHRDGTLTDVLYNASVYRDTSGHVLGVCAAARDVTK